MKALSDITVFNAGKKREEALRLLTKWLPTADSFSKAVKKNEGYIKSLEFRLEQKDEKLSSIATDIVMLERTAKEQKKLLAKLPPELLSELRSHRPTRKRR
jgi:hypothetical protein